MIHEEHLVFYEEHSDGKCGLFINDSFKGWFLSKQLAKEYFENNFTESICLP